MRYWTRFLPLCFVRWYAIKYLQRFQDGAGIFVCPWTGPDNVRNGWIVKFYLPKDV